ncbi:hypothetical protein ABPG77_002050 [Micractinium sp. CCAP 211/92]
MAKLYADSAALQERESALVAAEDRLQRQAGCWEAALLGPGIRELCCREESRLFEKEILLNQAKASLEARRAALQQALGWAQDEHAAPPGLPRGNDPMAVAFVEDAEAGFPGGYEAEGPASEGEDTEAGMRAAVQGENSSLAEAEPYPRAHE